MLYFGHGKTIEPSNNLFVGRAASVAFPFCAFNIAYPAPILTKTLHKTGYNTYTDENLSKMFFERDLSCGISICERQSQILTV